MRALERWETDITFIDSICSLLLSTDSEPGPVLCARGRETKVAQVWILVQLVGLEDKLPVPENSGQTVIRAVKRGQRARGSLKNDSQLLAA